MYVPAKYIATIMTLLLSQLYIYDLMPHTVYTATDSLAPNMPIYLCQPANDRAGWTAGFEPHRKRNSLLTTRSRIKVPRGIVKHVLCSRVTGLALEV